MAGGDSLKIKVDAHGNAVDELKRVQGAMKRNEKALKDLTGEGAASEKQTLKNVKAQAKFKDQMGGAAAAAKKAAVAIAAVVAVGKVLFEVAQHGAKLNDQMAVLDSQLGDFGLLAAQVKASTKGMFSSREITEAAVTFQAFNMETRQLPAVLKAIAETSIRTGKDMSFLLDSLVEGISKTSDMRLDNIGLIGVFKRARVELKATGAAYDDAALRSKALSIAVTDLNEANAGIDIERQQVTPYKQLAAALSDVADEAARVVATQLHEFGEATSGLWKTQEQELRELSDRLEHTTKRIADHNDHLGEMGARSGWLTKTQLILQAHAREYGLILAGLPLKQQAEAMADLTRRFGQQSPQVLMLIRRYSGLEEKAKQATASVEALNSAVESDGGKTWVKWLEKVDKITGAQADKAKKRRGSAQASARKARLSAQAGAEAQLRAAEGANHHAHMMTEASVELGRIDEISRRAKEKHAIEIAKKESQKVKAATINLLQVEFEVKHMREMAALREAAHAADSERARAAALNTVQLGAALKLARIEAKLAAAIEPIERARLEVQRARVQQSLALRTLSDDETEAAIQRVQVQTQLNSAMAVYNDEIAKASGADLAGGLQRVSDVMGEVSQKASGMGEVGAALAIVSGAAGDGAGIWAQYADAQIGVGSAIDGLIGVLGNAAGAFIADQQAKAAVASAFEAAASIAAFARLDIFGGIAHAAASAAFAAVASGAGGGASASSGGGGGGGGAPASAGATDEAEQRGGFGDGGGRQVIVQFGSGIILGSAAAVGQAVQQAQYANRGTGQAAGY